jgi:hypothetical protein
MRASRTGRLAWLLCFVSVAFGIGALVLLYLNGLTLGEAVAEGELLSAEAALTFPVVGALIASHRPGNAIGWIFCVIGLSQGLVEFSYLYAQYAFTTAPGSLPGADVAAWLNTWTWMPGFGFMLTFLPLLFPNGRLSSRRWVPVAWLSGLCIGSLILSAAVNLWPLRGVRLLGNVEAEVGWFEPALLLLLGCGIASALSLILRFLRSQGDERLQLKWFSFAVSSLAMLFVVSVVAPAFEEVLLAPIAFVVLPCVPAAAGIAIFKYRLYDIDLIINRALVYGSLSATLALAYLFCVVLLQQLLPLGQNSELAVAGSTLAVAALFRPARARIQDFIDRRFYRHKYDSEQTLEHFTTRLQDQIELDTLTTELLDLVKTTMQPAHASLWLSKLKHQS